MEWVLKEGTQFSIWYRKEQAKVWVRDILNRVIPRDTHEPELLTNLFPEAGIKEILFSHILLDISECLLLGCKCSH